MRVVSNEENLGIAKLSTKVLQLLAANTSRSRIMMTYHCPPDSNVRLRFSIGTRRLGW